MNAVFRGRAVVLPDGIRPAAVHVRDGLIERVAAYSDVADAIDAGDHLLMPGLVDTHVHLNEPGRTDWEGFASGTLAAAAGGITTVVDMPLNSVPATTTVAALERKRAAAAGQCTVDVAFWGGVVPDNEHEREPLWDAGVCGFKCFLSPSGVDEFDNVTEADLRRVLPLLGRLGAPLLVHAELPEHVLDPGNDRTHYGSWLASRPDRAETAAISLLASLSREYRAHIHIVHVSSAASLALLDAARRQGAALTAETCPHYLTFAAEAVPDGATEYKCAPPIRDAANREQLWQGLATGTLQMIASDHSPAPPAMKHADGDWFGAWGGIASLQLGLSAVWTQARGRGHGGVDVARWMAEQPALLAGLGARKGAIAAGRDADLVIFSPDEEWTVSADTLHHRHALTPYDGMRLRGRVRATYLRGDCVYADGRAAGQPRGRQLSRLEPAGAWTSPT